jgi:hypothetical protein
MGIHPYKHIYSISISTFIRTDTSLLMETSSITERILAVNVTFMLNLEFEPG